MKVHADGNACLYQAMDELAESPPENNRAKMSRRSFLQTGLVGVAGASLLPILPGARGASPAVAPSNRIAIGFIGTGRQAMHANIPAFLHQPDAQVVAVCDVDSWRMSNARRKVEDFYGKQSPSGSYKGCATHEDWRELIARKDIDAVMISTPDHWHVVMAMEAMKAGKDVSCEKPLTRSIAEGRLLSNAVKKHNRVFCTDSEFRTYRVCRQAAELVRNNKIGKLQRVITGTPKDPTLEKQPDMPVPPELNYDLWLGPAPERPYTVKRVHPRHEDKGRPGWLCIRDYADGMLANWGAHLNDVALWGMGANHTGPVEVDAKGTFPPQGNLWDVVLEFEANFLFADGVTLTCKTDKPYVRFEGTEGWIHVRYPINIELSNDDLLLWKPAGSDIVLPSMDSEKRNFLDAVKSRKQPMYDAEAGHRNASLSHLALASMELGRKIKWDPVRETAPNDPEANDKLAPKPLRKPWSL